SRGRVDCPPRGDGRSPRTGRSARRSLAPLDDHAQRAMLRPARVVVDAHDLVRADGDHVFERYESRRGTATAVENRVNAGHARDRLCGGLDGAALQWYAEREAVEPEEAADAEGLEERGLQVAAEDVGARAGGHDQVERDVARRWDVRLVADEAIAVEQR